MSEKKRKGKYIAGFLCLMAGLSIFSRFWLLGETAFRADEIDFYQYARYYTEIVELWTDPPWLDQIPLNESFSLLMVKAGLPVKPFFIRLPFALIGLLALFFVWRFARRRFGSGAALFVLVPAVFNPFALYHARAAYHYSGAICFSAALFLVFWSIKERLQKKEQPGYKMWILWFATATLACHMHMCVWIVTALQSLLLFIFGLRAFAKDKKNRRRFLIPFFTGCVLLGLVMSRWIYRAVQEVLTNVAGEGQFYGSEAGKEFLRLLPAYFAGENIYALLLLLIFIGLTVRALFGGSGRTRRLRSLAWICALHITVVMLYVAIVGRGVAKITYFSGVWAQFVLLIGAGAWCGIQALLRKKRRVRIVIQAMLAGGYILLTAVPDWAIIHLDGKPTPYYKINNWAVNNFPKGTLILTDRWLEPWSELRTHLPLDFTQFYYTFTVPDEPLQTYQENDWRTTAEQFFEKFPASAFLELQRGKYEKELGPWTFPQSYFARSVTITNEAALVLHRWKVLDFADAYTNRVITRIYYNTHDDLIAAARKAGHDVLRLYGPEWGYMKPGFEQGDYDDCRILEQSATVEVYNLKDTVLNGYMEIIAVAADYKVVLVDGDPIEFTPQDLLGVTLSQTLQPGKNTISFTSPSDVTFFVLDIRWSTNFPPDTISP